MTIILKTFTLVCLLFLASLLHAETPALPASFKTNKGIELRNAKITSTTATSIKVMHDGGFANLPHDQLPETILAIIGIQPSAKSLPSVELPDPLKTSKSEYSKPTLLAVDPDGIRISHALGNAKIKHEELPPELIAAVGPFDVKKAEEYRVAEQEKSRAAYASTRAAIMDAQNADIEQRRAESAALEAQKTALVEDPNLISDAVAVTITAYASGGKSRDTTYLTDWGSHAWTDTQKRSMVCYVTSRIKGYQRARIQCIFFTKEVSGGKDELWEIVADDKVSLGPLAAKTVDATATAQTSDEQYAAIGLKYRTGVKYAGWCWRAIDGKNRVSAVYSSSAEYDQEGWRLPLE